jgi:hypothetical protein
VKYVKITVVQVQLLCTSLLVSLNEILLAEKAA